MVYHIHCTILSVCVMYCIVLDGNCHLPMLQISTPPEATLHYSTVPYHKHAIHLWKSSSMSHGITLDTMHQCSYYLGVTVSVSLSISSYVSLQRWQVCKEKKI